MKKLLLALSLFFFNSLSAQFQLEHTYSTDIAYRTKFGFSGEKYFLLNRSTRDVEIYHTDHTIWKTIHLPIPPNVFVLNLNFVSDDKINSDNLVEIGFSYSLTGSIVRKSQIINENGEVLLTVDNGNRIEYSHIDGLPDKILATVNSTRQVYALPSLVLEATHNNPVKRIKLETAGEKYYYYDSANAELKIYNNSTLWWVVPLSVPAAAIDSGVSLISEILDPSVGLEVCYYIRLTDDTYEGRIANRFGQTLLTVPNGYFFSWSEIDGLNTKLNVLTRGFSTGDFERNTIYGINPLQQEHVYDENIWRFQLENSGEKYASVNSGDGMVNVYNSDHSLWRTINLGAPSGFDSEFHVKHLSETEFDEDEEIEIVYSSQGSLGNQSIISKESGAELLNVPDCIYLEVSKIEGLETKVLGTMTDGASFFNWTTVFSINASLSANDFVKISPILWPNPASSVINVNAQAAITNIRVYNGNGVLVKKISPNGTQLPTAELANGLYLFHLEDIEGQTSIHKILVKH